MIVLQYFHVFLISFYLISKATTFKTKNNTHTHRHIIFLFFAFLMCIQTKVSNVLNYKHRTECCLSHYNIAHYSVSQMLTRVMCWFNCYCMPFPVQEQTILHVQQTVNILGNSFHCNCTFHGGTEEYLIYGFVSHFSMAKKKMPHFLLPPFFLVS